MTGDSPRTTVTLAAGTEVVEVGEVATGADRQTGARTSGVIYVALPEDESPMLTIDFAGVETVLDTATGEVNGAGAEAMAGLQEERVDRCSDGRVGGGRAEVVCGFTMVRVPYLSGRGWSDDGWTVVQMETRVDHFYVRGDQHVHAETVDASRLLGAGRSTSEEVLARRSSLVTRLSAQGRATSLRVRLEIEGSRVQGDGPDIATINYSALVPLNDHDQAESSLR